MRRAVLSFVALALAAACGSVETTSPTSGTVGPSSGPGGASQSGGSGGSGGDPSNASSGGDGGAGLTGACTPGEEVDCYTGPAGTEGIGICESGTAICDDDGVGFGDCVGEVTPEPETCTTPVDDDCDDEINEAGDGCVCSPDSAAYCYTGDPATEGVGACTSGIKTCNSEGTAYGACEDEVLPGTEDCSTPLDEDCDGTSPLCQPDWSLVFGDVNSQFIHAVATDAAGNVFLAGEFEGTVNIGGTNHTSLGLSDILVAKLDPNGTRLWSRAVGNTDTQAALALAVDGAGHAWLTGYFRGASISFGTVLNNGSAATADIFLVKLDGANGNQLFASRFGDASDDQVGTSLAVDANNNVLLGGYMTGTFNFNTTGGTCTSKTSAGLTDAFIARYTSAGLCQFSQRYGNNNVQRTNAVAFGAGAEMFLAGEFNGTIDLGGGAIASAGQTDAFVAELNPTTGAHVWSKSFGNAGVQIARAMTVGGIGGPIVAGDFDGAVDFGDGAVASAGQLDVFVVELDIGDGAHVQSSVFGGTGNEGPFGIDYDPAGYILLAGYTTGSIDFGGDPIVSEGGRDGFVAKVDDAGGPWWARGFGDETFYQEASSVAVDAAGNVIAGGHFSGSADLGLGTVTSAGGTDGFVVKYAP